MTPASGRSFDNLQALKTRDIPSSIEPGHHTIQPEGKGSEGATRAINAGVLIQAGSATGGGGLAVPVPGLTPLMTAILAALLSGLGLWVRRDQFIIQAPPHKAASTHRKTPNRAILKK